MRPSARRRRWMLQIQRRRPLRVTRSLRAIEARKRIGPARAGAHFAVGFVCGIDVDRTAPVFRRLRFFEFLFFPRLQVELFQRAVEVLHFDRRIVAIDCDDFEQRATWPAIPVTYNRTRRGHTLSPCSTIRFSPVSVWIQEEIFLQSIKQSLHARRYSRSHTS